MLHPSYTDLINAANIDVEPGEHPVVQSRYSIVIATSRRARQLVEQEAIERRNSERPLSNGGKKPLSVAVEELYDGKVRILAEDEDEENEE